MSFATTRRVRDLPGARAGSFARRGDASAREQGAVLGGIACSSAALVVLAFATHGWLVFAVMPVFALGGIGTPALQARATRQVDPTLQGQLQGVLASAVSAASIVAPLAFSTIYCVVERHWPGAIWLSVVATHALAVPLIVLGTKTGRERAPTLVAEPPLSTPS